MPCIDQSPSLPRGALAAGRLDSPACFPGCCKRPTVAHVSEPPNSFAGIKPLFFPRAFRSPRMSFSRLARSGTLAATVVHTICLVISVSFLSARLLHVSSCQTRTANSTTRHRPQSTHNTRVRSPRFAQLALQLVEGHPLPQRPPPRPVRRDQPTGWQQITSLKKNKNKKKNNNESLVRSTIIRSRSPTPSCLGREHMPCDDSLGRPA